MQFLLLLQLPPLSVLDSRCHHLRCLSDFKIASARLSSANTIEGVTI